jgi:hypothetical protein
MKAARIGKLPGRNVRVGSSGSASVCSGQAESLGELENRISQHARHGLPRIGAANRV